MWSKTRSATPVCPHSNGETEKPTAKIMAAWNFNELLGEWDPTISEDTIPWVTKVLDSHLKYNVAMSLGASCIVVRNPECCLSCALESVSSRKEALGCGLGTSFSIIGFQPSHGTLARR